MATTWPHEVSGKAQGPSNERLGNVSKHVSKTRRHDRKETRNSYEGGFSVKILVFFDKKLPRFQNAPAICTPIDF